MKMKLQGAKLNNCETIKEIKEVSRRHLQKNLGDCWTWRVNGVLQHSPEKQEGTLQLSTQLWADTVPWLKPALGLGATSRHWSEELCLGADSMNNIPQEEESRRKDAAAEEAGAGKSIWAQPPVAKAHKKYQWGSSSRGNVLVGPDGMTSSSPTKADSDFLHILVGLVLLVLPGNGMWDGGAGRGGCLSWESWKRLQ